MAEPVIVAGGGLAGCEAAWQLARLGNRVRLMEMKPRRYSPAHHSGDLAELVCSNSLRSDRLENAVGLLKEEMRRMGSLILRAADATRVPAGGALAVDREGFSRYITAAIENHPLIELVREEVAEIPEGPCVIATGPLTADALANRIAELGTLSFFDAAAPIVARESLNMEVVFRASRYGRGEDYLNCPMNAAEYEAFHRALVAAETADPHGFEKKRVFEGCLPVEILAERGALTFGPLKPVGLTDPRTGRMPFAVVQLRQDDAAGEMFNLVGFQTRLKQGEQRRVFRMIPGLENAQFLRYGVMHRNTFLKSPGLLTPQYRLKDRPAYFAGQMTGVEGYVESAASGMVAGLALALELQGEPPLPLNNQTALGALGCYISGYAGSNFQPMNMNYGLMEPLAERVRNKKERYERIARRALERVDAVAATVRALESAAK